MADRAASDNKSPEGVVDLSNDDRWQARLEEARSRREIALREKGKDPSAAPKRKLMPWEKEEGFDAGSKIEPVIQDPDTDRVDFADRVDKVRETVGKDDKTVGEPPSEKVDAPTVAKANAQAPDSATLGFKSVQAVSTDEGSPASARVRSAPRSTSTRVPTKVPTAVPTNFDDLLTDEAFNDDIEEDVTWVPPPKKRHSVVTEDAPDVIELASRYASTLSPGANAGSVDVFEAVEKEVKAPRAVAPVRVRNHPPALLILSIVALAALPFSMTVPPLERGPAMPVTPTLRLQPALGFTTAMLWRPVETSSTQWQPSIASPLPLATVFSPQPLVVVSEPDLLGAPEVEQTNAGFAAPLAEAATPRPAQPPVLDGAAIDRLPGAFSRRPVPRPLDGTPVTDLRAPSRQPAVSTGNDTSPRLAPNADSDATLLDQATELATVMFDRAPVVAERAMDALQTPQTADVTAPESPLVLTILTPATADGSVASQFANDALERGHALGSIKTVNVSIRTRNLRFFHEADRSEAERLAEAYGAEVRSFTSFTPKPSRGTVELWLEGRASAPVRAAPVVRRIAPAPTPTAPTPQVVIVRKPEGILTRLFGGHRVGEATVGGSDGTSSVSSIVVTSPQTPPTTGGPGTDTGTDTETDDDTGAGTDTDAGSGTDTGNDTGSGTDTDTGGGADSGSGTDSGTTD